MRQIKKKRTSFRWGFVLTLCLALSCVAFCVSGLGLSFATAHDDEFSSATFGIKHESLNLTAFEDKKVGSNTFVVNDTSALNATTPRDNSQGINEILAEEKAKENAKITQANNRRSAYIATFGSLPAGDVDFSIGEKAFIETWTKRINDYLRGYPLAGYGEVFARAAWENGVDPRWSPAISNTESTRGSVCFLPHNAWGWGASAWGNWSTAIESHVRGLADYYGFTIAYSFAQKYCPPNYDSWYQETLNEMQKI